MAEVLVILESAGIGAVKEAAAASQSIGDRIFIADLPDPSVVALKSRQGVSAVLTGNEGDPVLPRLDEAESLFVQAWLSGRRQKKQRTGEGLNWDAPPMIPPDRGR